MLWRHLFILRALSLTRPNMTADNDGNVTEELVIVRLPSPPRNAPVNLLP